MDLQVPLNRLKFGHQDGAGINARVPAFRAWNIPDAVTGI